MTYFPNICTAVAIGSSTAGDDTGSLIEQIQDIKSGKIILDKEHFQKNVKDGYTRKYLKNNPNIMTEEIHRKLETGSEILTAIMENIAYNYNLYQDLEAIDVPTLILHGERDKTLHHIFSIKLHDVLPNSLLITIPKMGHGINYEIPEQIGKHLIEFFQHNS
jgi:pimeloyl-ACP methyl ester carboxylesterase